MERKRIRVWFGWGMVMETPAFSRKVGEKRERTDDYDVMVPAAGRVL